MGQDVEYVERLRRLLDSVRVRGAVDWGWQWWISSYRCDHPAGHNYHPDGWLIWATYRRPDIDSLQPGLGTTRREFVPRGATESAVFETAFVILRLTVEHELMESFTIDGTRPFNPHHTVAELSAVRGRVVG
jgi:hypothetical protein